MSTPKQKYMVALRMKYKGYYEAVTLAIYTVVVYAWMIGAGPFPRDHAVSLAPDAYLSAPMAAIMVWLSGSIPPHIVNMTLMTGCMWGIYILTNTFLSNPFWIGTLAATLFMANPATSEAVFHQTGVTDLLPCFLLIWALVGYTRAGRSRWMAYAAALTLAGVAFALSRPIAGAALAFPLYEWLLAPKERRSYARSFPFLAAGVAGFILLSPADAATGIANRFAPLYFMFYPLGFLPENAVLFHAWPIMGIAAAVAVFAILGFIVYKARNVTIIFSLLALFATRLAGDRSIDFVTLMGGGGLLMAGVFYHIGFVALCRSIMMYPQWRATMVWLTTLLCIAFFGMTIHRGYEWRHDCALTGEKAPAVAVIAGDAGAATTSPGGG